MSDPGDDDLGYQRITLRIPRELHERLMTAAKSSSKSMNAEIVARLEQSFRNIAGETRLEVAIDRLTRLAETLERNGLDLGQAAELRGVADERRNQLDHLRQSVTLPAPTPRTAVEFGKKAEGE